MPNALERRALAWGTIHPGQSICTHSLFFQEHGYVNSGKTGQYTVVELEYMYAQEMKKED